MVWREGGAPRGIGGGGQGWVRLSWEDKGEGAAKKVSERTGRHRRRERACELCHGLLAGHTTTSFLCLDTPQSFASPCFATRHTTN
jgi:hypothetical protein